MCDIMSLNNINVPNYTFGVLSSASSDDEGFDINDIIRDTLAARSNSMLPTKSVYADRAAKLYDDWEDCAGLPEGIRYRAVKPHAFHARIGKWVPTSSVFNYCPDIRDWVLEHVTSSQSDRDYVHREWCNSIRSLRISSPYYYKSVCKEDIDEFRPASIIVKNTNNSMSDADICMAFSVFGPIVDYYRPINYGNKKKSFYVFIEYFNVKSANAAYQAMNNEQFYYSNMPIMVELAGPRKAATSFMSS